MGLITKNDVQQSVIKLHQSGKKYPLEYEKTKACRTVDEINSLYKAFVIQLTNSIWDYFSVAKVTLPSKEAWEKATFVAMAETGDISAKLMLNALKKCRQEASAEVIKEEDTVATNNGKPFTLEDKMCNAMLGKFTTLWGVKYNLLFFEDYPVSNNEIECEMDRLGLPISKAGYKRKVVWAGLKLRKYYQDKNISESDVDEDGNYRLYTKRTLTAVRGLPVIWELMPQVLQDSLTDELKKDMLSKLA